MMTERTWAVTELQYPLPSGDSLCLVCAPKHPSKPLYSFEIRKEGSIIFQIQCDSLDLIKNLLGEITNGVAEFTRNVKEVELFDEAISMAKTAKQQVALEKAQSKRQGLVITKIEGLNSGNIGAASLLGQPAPTPK